MSEHRFLLSCHSEVYGSCLGCCWQSRLFSGKNALLCPSCHQNFPVSKTKPFACLQDPLNIYNFSILLWCLQVDRRVHVVLDSVLGIFLKCLHSTVSSSAPCWYVRVRHDSRARTVLHTKTSTATRLMRSMWRHFWQCIWCIFESACLNHSASVHALRTLCISSRATTSANFCPTLSSCWGMQWSCSDHAVPQCLCTFCTWAETFVGNARRIKHLAKTSNRPVAATGAQIDKLKSSWTLEAR